MNVDEIQQILKEHQYSHCSIQWIDTKKITSELMDVLGKYDLAVADAIRILGITKNKILTRTKFNPQRGSQDK